MHTHPHDNTPLRFPPISQRDQIRDTRNLAIDADLAVEAAISRLAVERYADPPDLDQTIAALVDAVVARERLTVRLAALVQAVRRG